MNIDKLLNKRQHNVQEQNAVLKSKIVAEATYWRREGLPTPLEEKLISLNIDVSSCLVLDYEQDFPGICSDDGTILATTGKFYKFEAELNSDRTKLVAWYELEEITKEIEISAHKKGTGATWGFLAMEVLNELNSSN